MDRLLKTEEKAILTLRQLYRQYGYTPYKMSRFEEYDLYVRSKDFLVSDQIITFSGDRGRLMALKPDVTLSIVKNAPEEPGLVQKVYYNENVYRDYREIMQAGLECVGDLGSYEIAEVVLLAAKSLALLGDSYVLDISHVGLLSAVLDGCGFDEAAKKQAMTCIRRKSPHELRSICADDAAWQKLQTLTTCHGKTPDAIRPILTAPEELAAWEELKNLWTILEERDLAGHVRLDFSVGNNMRYYSGVVFRGYLAGIPSSVLSGGQYDKLPKRLGRNARAIGFAIYVDLLQGEKTCLDVDTLILHDGTVSSRILTAAAEEAAKAGTVLVAREKPQGRTWKTLIQYEKGERTC